MKIKDKCQQITSFFENGTIKFNYNYAKNLKDGRGITCGKAGFCTGTSDAYKVVKKYSELNKESKLSQFLPELLRLNTAKDRSDTSGLVGFEEIWKHIKDDKFIKAQDFVIDKVYWKPSQQYIKKFGFKLPISSAVLYDTIIQHGEGDDPDSLGGLIKQVESWKSELDWLQQFIDIRYKDLMHANDEDTRAVWKESAERVLVLKKLIEKNPNLKTPFKIKCFGNMAVIQ